MKKKGALELSVNAIVILILAIVMLGLGLGFVRGMFGKVSLEFEGLIGQEQDPGKPSSSDPISLSRENIIVSSEGFALKARIYNPSSLDWTAAGPFIDCGTGTDALKFDRTSNKGSVDIFSRDISRGEEEKFQMKVTMPKAATEGTHLCRIIIKKTIVDNKPEGGVAAGYEKDITITVKA